jgi:hypothetical protein
MKPLIYISGPYSNGSQAENVSNAIKAADYLVKHEFLVYVPHLTHFWHVMSPKPYTYWLELDLRILPMCNAVLRLPGDSVGADREVRAAEKIGIRVFTNRFSVCEHYEALRCTLKK